MEKTIVIRGIGSAAAAPDIIEIAIVLNATDIDYQRTMTMAANQYAQICAVLTPLGFSKKDLKTTMFNVDTQYENMPDGHGGYKRCFNGYHCAHALRLEFGFSMQRLAQVLTYLSRSEAKPEFSIKFTVKQSDTLHAKALMAATANAYRNATVLTKASRTVLGEIILIEYGAKQALPYSPTSFGNGSRAAMLMSADNHIEMQPEDVSIEESVNITWSLQ
ncbi:MAG: SIMPL domain-containing protein [Oscillospiraceae bacterium]